MQTFISIDKDTLKSILNTHYIVKIIHIDLINGELKNEPEINEILKIQNISIRTGNDILPNSNLGQVQIHYDMEENDINTGKVLVLLLKNKYYIKEGKNQ